MKVLGLLAGMSLLLLPALAWGETFTLSNRTWNYTLPEGYFEPEATPFTESPPPESVAKIFLPLALAEEERFFPTWFYEGMLLTIPMLHITNAEEFYQDFLAGVLKASREQHGNSFVHIVDDGSNSPESMVIPNFAQSFVYSRQDRGFLLVQYHAMPEQGPPYGLVISYCTIMDTRLVMLTGGRALSAADEFWPVVEQFPSFFDQLDLH